MNREIIEKVLPAVRMLASRERVLLARFDDRDLFAALEDASALYALPFVKKEASVLVVDESVNAEEILSDLEVKLAAWYDSRSLHPDYLLLKGIGVVALAETASWLDILLGKPFESLQVVHGRMCNRIVVVTGGAQGFGAGIAGMLYSQGANVVIADMNEEEGLRQVDSLRAKKQSNGALFVRVNVADAESVRQMVAQTVCYFGGLDVIISNAGILRAGGLEEMSPETFALMTDINYTGYFLCAKYASAVMKLQARYREDYFMDIIQINSKSGLKGSNRNFAYAGGKFGGIGLTQSFAMELMPYRIKVNAICPGNFFEGPLWSDPETGLFVQYLRTGKVPGAKTLSDVKAFYESQVPAGRGCRVIDVVRAIYYLIEQEYETGQAVPVTGGQNMLK